MESEHQPSTFGSELTLSDELREQLGLAPDESIRVLHAGGSTLLLERACSVSRIAVPWDRDWVLTADVRAFPLADILGMIHESGKSGFLYFRFGDHEKSVYLHRGEVVFATSNQKVDRLGESLLRSGIISLEQLREAEHSFSPPERFGKVLVQRGILTPRGLWNGVKAQVEETVRSLFSYTAGIVHLWEGEVQPDNVVRLSLPTNRLVAEGVARRDELFRMVALLEDPRVKLQRVSQASRDLAANEQTFLDALDGARDFAAVCRHVGLDRLSGARTVQLLSLVGAVRVERCEEAPPAEGRRAVRNEDESVRECVMDHVKLLAELAAPIVAVDGANDVAQRMAGVMADVAERHPALLSGVVPGPGGSLDPEELSRRALRLKGERVREVGTALGELVAYLEFELRNHPRIQEPDHFLEAVDGLRAKLEF